MKIIKIPFSEGSLGKNIGCEKAPAEIAKLLKVKTKDLVEVAVSSDFEKTQNEIYRTAKKFLNEKCIFLGGDHSITFSTFKAFSETKRNSALVYFDAHADCMPCCSLHSHEDVITGLFREKKLNRKNLLMLGIRKVYPQETAFVKKKKLQVFHSSDFRRKMKTVLRKVREFADEFGNIYVSVDIDAFDPKIAPATGYLVVKGLSRKEFYPAFEVLLKSGKVKAIDLIEVNPEFKGGKKTAELAKEVVKQFILRK